MWSAVKQKGTVCVAEDVHRVEQFSHKIVQVHQWGRTPQTACHVGTPARLRAPTPKPNDKHAVHVCLIAVAAHVSMSDDTETGKLWRTCHRTVSRNCFGISVTPIFNRQNSSKRLSAGLVLASATFSRPGTLLIRTFLLAVSACNHRNRTCR